MPYDQTRTEAVAVFHDSARLQAAIDDLLTHGFDHAELSVLASEHAIRAKLGHDYNSTTEFEDDPDVPRAEVTPNETIGNAQGALIGIGAYFPAVIGSLAVIGSGGTMLGAIAVAAIAGGAGAAVGATLARLVGRTHARHLEEHLKHGGLLLWVRTHDARHEAIALEVLKRHGGDHVHLHVLADSKEAVPPIATHRPLLWLGPDEG